jgi:hypothetical protein
MNERIGQLAIEAFFDEDTNVVSDKIYTFNEEKMQKFAELIVEECIAQCWTVSELESNGYVVSKCSKKIRKHFGVEL